MGNFNQRFLIGSHVSIAKGLEYVFERGAMLGCTCIQIFTKNCRQWSCKPLSNKEIEAFKEQQKKFGIEPVVVHASYLINIGSDDRTTEQRGVALLKQELTRCIQLEIPYLVLHPGSMGSSTLSDCLERITNNLNEVFLSCSGKTMILLENTAGQGSNVGFSLDHLGFILEKSTHKERLGFCFDTCHAFAAGYSFSNESDYAAFWQQWHTILGLHKLKVIHLNDSLKEKGSRVDRHAHIGKGKMGIEPFRLLVNDSRFFDIPKIIETPKNLPDDDFQNLKTLYELLTPTTKTLLAID